MERNLPNMLTLLRIALTGVFVLLLIWPGEVVYRWALAVFIIASITDYLDGRIARARGQVTNFGTLFDPVADKVLTGAAFVYLSALGVLAPWITIFILSRDFLVTGMRTLAASKGAILKADNLGKWKTATQIATVVVLLALLAWPQARTDATRLVELVLVTVTAALTVISGTNYLWKNRALFLAP